METRPKFKNSFGVAGSPGEILHFKEIADKLGWIHFKGGKEKFDEFIMFSGYSDYEESDALPPGHYWSPDALNSEKNEVVSLYTPSGWQRAISLAEEKEEEVPEYNQGDLVLILKDFENGRGFYTGKIGMFKDYAAAVPEYKYRVSVMYMKSPLTVFEIRHLTPEEKDKFIRQELLEEAKKREQPLTFESAVRPLIKFIAENYELNTSVMVTSAGAELLNGCQVFSTQEYLKEETLNKTEK